MKTTELISLLQDEVKHFGDRDFVMYCPTHSGEEGEPVPVHGLGWYGHIEKNISATFLECVECHHDGMAEKAESEAMAEIEAGAHDHSCETELCGEDAVTLEEFDL